MAGIGRAAEIAVCAMGEAAGMLREAAIDGDDLWLAGERLTAEAVRTRVRELCARAGAPAPAPADSMVKPMGAMLPLVTIRVPVRSSSPEPSSPESPAAGSRTC